MYETNAEMQRERRCQREGVNACCCCFHFLSLCGLLFCTQQRDDLSFCVVNLQHSRRVDTQAAIESILGSLRGPITGSGEGEDEDEDYLAILTAQAPLRPMQNLQKQKQRVISSGGASVFTWDHSQEKQLLLEARKANKGQICFLTSADAANKPEETK